MKRSLSCLALLVATLVCECSAAYAAPPVIASVEVDRGRDVSEEGDVFYHERVWVTVTDADGAGDVESITITDSEGGVHAVGPSGATDAGWWEEDAITVGLVWEDWGTSAPPPPGPYSVTVADLADNSASLTTAAAPEVPEVTPELLTPAPNYSLITDTVPVFSWLEGVPGADNCFHISDESTGEEVWHDCFGSSTSVVYNFDGNATEPELIPGHSYAWQIDAWSCEDCGVSDPRVSLLTSPHAFGRFTVYDPDSVVQEVLIDRGRDTDAPDWPCCHQRVRVLATDPDGTGDIVAVTLTDPDGGVHTVTPSEGGSWWEEGNYTIGCEWSEWKRLDPTAAGAYTIAVTDASANEDILVTPPAPAVSETHPELLSPPMDTVIYDTTPTFEWTTGLPGSTHSLRVEEEGTWGAIWRADLGDSTSAAYNFDGTAAQAELQANHSCFWEIESWYPDDDRVSDPRVSIWSSQFTRGRFAVYGDWPETPPELPGKLAYSACHWGQVGDPPDPITVEWGMESIMGYSTDPSIRQWLGPDWSSSPDWSPDGSELLYSKHPGIWIRFGEGGPSVEITGLSGFDCRWSPDGSKIVYTRLGPWSPYLRAPWWNPDIWIANADGSDAHPIVDSVYYEERYPAWSPDGQWIAYGKARGDPWLWLVRPDGTDDHPVIATGVVGYPDCEVTLLGWETAWSPDGKTLATIFEAGPPGSPWPGGRFWGIGTVSPEGGLVTPVFISRPQDLCCTSAHVPQWSPDGTKIVFSSGHHLPDPAGWGEFDPGVELWMINADGSGEPVRLTYDYSFDGFVSWWAPNTAPGGPVYVTLGDVTAIFEEVTEPGSTTIVVCDELPAPEPEGLTFVEGFGYHIATSATISGTVTVEMDYSDTGYPPVLGERLSLLVWDGEQWVDITVSPVDTANHIITGQFTPGAEREWYVVLALDCPPVPDVKVMFQACTEGRPAGPGTYVADADLSNPVRLLPLTRGTARLPECVCGCGELAPVWSPDGTRVVMGRTDSGTLEMLDLTALIQSPGQVAYTLTDELDQPIYGQMPGWSPSGDQIVYASVVDPMAYPALWDAIRAVNPDGTDMHSLYTFPEPTADNIRWIAWSPDGARIVFEKAGWIHYEAHLWVLEDLDDPGGAALRQLTTDDSYTEDTPHWSPDGNHVVFTRSPTGSAWWEDDGSEIWVKNVGTGVEMQITDEPGIAKLATGWCPYDGYIYYVAHPAGDAQAPESVHRMLPDGTGIETVASDISPLLGTLERWSWAPTGVWIDGLNALPGEAVTAKMGIADAESLAGVQASVHYTGLCNTLAMYSVEQADAILDWTMPAPVIGPNVASFLAFAPDPENQNISGPGHLFDLNVVNDPDAQPADIQLLTFDDLLLSDEWGDPIDRVSFDGGVRTVPFAYLEVSDITGPVCADLEDPVPFTVTVTALDWEGWSMPDCDVTIELGVLDWGTWRYLAEAITPTSVALTDGVWSGEVTIAEPKPSMQIVAHWEDMGGTSNAVQAIGRGDPSGDSRISIFDVVKIANMAIERGEWEPWQWWAADLNGDEVVNVFDVVICANEAMAAMETMGVGRAGAPPVVTPPSELVIVTTDVSASGGQVVLSVKVSDCAGLAGIQVELAYDAKKLAYAGVSGGELLAGARGWAVMGNDLGGTVKAIAYTSSAEVLPGGDGAILTFTFNQTGKGKAKVRLASVELADVEGSEIPSQTSTGKGGGKGKAR